MLELETAKTGEETAWKNHCRACMKKTCIKQLLKRLGEETIMDGETRLKLLKTLGKKNANSWNGLNVNSCYLAAGMI